MEYARILEQLVESSNKWPYNYQIMYLLAGTPPDWRYCQINSIIID